VDAETGQCEALGATLEAGGVNAIVAHPHFPVVLCAHDGGSISTYDTRAGKALASFAAETAADGASALSLSHGASILASGSHAGAVRLWDLRAAKRELAHARPHAPKRGEGVHSLAFVLSGGAELLCSAGADGAIAFFSVREHPQ